MRCANCGFHNMPGSEVCGRCSTSMGLATAVLDVHPPRATPIKKRLRRVLPPVRKGYYRAVEALHAGDVVARARRATRTLPPIEIFARLIVPGWTHWYFKQPVRAILYFTAFLLCIIPALLLFGTGWGSFWLGMAFSVHSTAALDVVNQTFAEAGTRDRIARSILVSVALGVCVYWPAMELIGLVAQPHTLMMDISPFHTGDVVLVSSRIEPYRGEVVLFNFGQYSIDSTSNYRRRAVQIFEGDSIDRILAIAGDHVQSDGMALLIDGKPSPWRPLNPLPLPKRLNYIVPPDHYLAIPSGAPGLTQLGDAAFWTSTGTVSRDSIAGHAYLQSLPFTRFHFID
jgi:hypothetical protein